MRKRYGFTQVPMMWRQQLRKVNARGTTSEVAMTILDKARWAEWVTLPNYSLAKRGISRYTKYDALKQLVAAGTVPLCILRLCILRLCILRLCILRLCILRLCILLFLVFLS